MSLKSKWLFVLVGNDQTGKTTLQKKIIKQLSDNNRDIRLDCNLIFNITHPYLIRKIRDFSIGNRSYQEKKNDYVSVEGYFNNHFQRADIAFFSSHLITGDVLEIIKEAHKMYYNVCGVFFTNSIDVNPTENAQISELLWDERVVAINPTNVNLDEQDKQLQSIAESLTQMLIHRTLLW